MEFHYDNELDEIFRFRINEEYELNEFNLETLESITINNIEVELYKYIKGDFNFLFGLKIREIQLGYNGDILCLIKFIFQDNSEKLLEHKLRYLLNIKGTPIHPNKTLTLLQNELNIKYQS